METYQGAITPISLGLHERGGEGGTALIPEKPLPSRTVIDLQLHQKKKPGKRKLKEPVAECVADRFIVWRPLPDMHSSPGI